MIAVSQEGHTQLYIAVLMMSVIAALTSATERQGGMLYKIYMSKLNNERQWQKYQVTTRI